MENARKFLARAVPWPTAHDNWWISIHWGWQREGRKGISFGQAFKDLDQAARWIEYLRDQKGSDMYVCMSGISVVEQRTSQKGRLLHRAQRLTQNAVALRSLWLDVDVATDLKPKGFRSTMAALEAFGRFVQASGLPAPTFLVMSGSGGFHVHWVLEDPISTAEWLPLAGALAAATRHFAFIPLDTQVVINPVCLLRVPDTFNWKTDPPKAVWMPRRGQLVSVEKISAVLAPFVGQTTVRAPAEYQPGQSLLGAAFAPRAPLPFNRRQAYPELSFQGTIDDVGVTCPFIAETLRTHGEGLKEPVWFESLKVAYYTSDPIDAAHRLSSDHAGYDPDETEEKLGHVEKDRQRRDLGWPQCNTIHDSGAEQCPACPHFGKGQSPLNFVSTVASGSLNESPVTKSELVVSNHNGNGAAVDLKVNAAGTPPPVVKPTWYLPLPAGYVESPNHYVFKLEETDANTVMKLPVAGLPMWNFWTQEPANGRGGVYAINFKAGLNARSEPEIHLPYTYLSDQRSMCSHLAEQGFVVDRKTNASLFGGLMTAFIDMLRAQNKLVLPCENLGWSYDDGKRSAFVYSRTRFNCTGNTPVSHPDRALDQEYSQAGTLEGWQLGAKLVTDQKIPALDAIVAASFGAPLVAPCGYSGMMVSAYSLETGVGKSVAMRVGEAVWSNPDVAPGLIDTANYANTRLGQIRHLPFFYDELRAQSQTKDFVNLMFAMGQGKSKGRLNRQAVSQPVSTFATLILVASNNGVGDIVAKNTQMTTAGIHRLMEWPVPRNADKVGMIDGATAQQITSNLGHNFGHPGLIYAQFLGQNASKVDRHLGSLNKHIMERLKATQEERFWAGTVAVLIMGARYANDLKLTEIDDTALMQFLFDQFEQQRHNRHGSRTDVNRIGTIQDYLGDYLNDRRQQTMISQYVWTQPSRPPAGYTAGITTAMEKLFGRMTVRAASIDKILRISKNDFSDWLEKRGVQARPIFDRLPRILPVRTVRGSITAHTTIQTAMETLFEIDLAKEPDLFDFK
jgi:uncharacterized protein DUF927